MVGDRSLFYVIDIAPDRFVSTVKNFPLVDWGTLGCFWVALCSTLRDTWGWSKSKVINKTLYSTAGSDGGSDGGRWSRWW